VCSLPEPAKDGSPVYQWLYRSSHTIAGNLTTALSGRIPGTKAVVLVLLVPLLWTTSACAAHHGIHPGALNKADSAAYDALLIAETTIDQARLDFKAGRLPAESKDALDALIRSYNVARVSWLTYREAVAADTSSEINFDQLTKTLSDLAKAIRTFEEAK
jgi:hypothetical protein